MDESMVGIVALSAISLIVSVVTHCIIKHYGKALLISGIISSVLFQIAGYIVMGYLDPFFIIALITGGIVAVCISVIVGIPFLLIRKNKKGS